MSRGQGLTPEQARQLRLEMLVGSSRHVYQMVFRVTRENPQEWAWWDSLSPRERLAAENELEDICRSVDRRKLGAEPKKSKAKPKPKKKPVPKKPKRDHAPAL